MTGPHNHDNDECWASIDDGEQETFCDPNWRLLRMRSYRDALAFWLEAGRQHVPDWMW